MRSSRSAIFPDCKKYGGAGCIYEVGFAIRDLFPINVLGFQTHRDAFAIADTLPKMRQRITEFAKLEIKDEVIRTIYRLVDNRDWKMTSQRIRAKKIGASNIEIGKCAYRPFDNRYCVLDYITMDFPRNDLMLHVKEKENICLIATRQQATEGFFHAFLTSLPANDCLMSTKSREANQVFPLYLYPAPNSLETTRRINFDPKIYAAICKAAGIAGADGDELRVFDYIYGVLHSPDYRATYAQFLKIDFPRIPFPASPEIFAHVADKGNQLRRLHLMEPEAIGTTPYPFMGEGNDVVTKPVRAADGRVLINAGQYFADIPEIAWNFHIGGYQPAQKWLKDRKGRVLSFDDILHYQRIIKILVETDRIMKEIELPLQ